MQKAVFSVTIYNLKYDKNEALTGTFEEPRILHLSFFLSTRSCCSGT